jgi:hypothetical protein
MVVMHYRTQDGLADYGFSIEFQPDRGWRVYVVFDPFHKGQDDSPKLPYQSKDDNGHRYVDWPSKFDSLGDAKTVAELWAELAQRYQRVQEERDVYVELIQRYQRTQEQKRGNNEAAKTTESTAHDEPIGAVDPQRDRAPGRRRPYWRRRLRPRRRKVPPGRPTHPQPPEPP